MTLDTGAGVNTRLAANTALQSPSVSDFNGCIDADTSLSVNVTSDGDLFGIFGGRVDVPVFDHSWDIWKVSHPLSHRRLSNVDHFRNAPVPVIV